jgi:hypothetical protein
MIQGHQVLGKASVALRVGFVQDEIDEVETRQKGGLKQKNGNVNVNVNVKNRIKSHSGMNGN